MDRLWSNDGATTVREIFEELHRQREIAYTTVMSTMDNLHHKGWLSRTKRGKAYLYTPQMTRERYSAGLMHEALNAGGRSELVLAAFLEQIGAEESAVLRQALRRSATRKHLPLSQAPPGSAKAGSATPPPRLIRK